MVFRYQREAGWASTIQEQVWLDVETKRRRGVVPRTRSGQLMLVFFEVWGSSTE